MFDLFKSPLRIAKDKYNLCQRHRSESLLEFRKNAAREILLMHPDAALLIGTTFDNFLAYSRKDDVLVSGSFIDKHFPRIDFVETESVDEYVSAASKYRQKIDEYSSNLFIPRNRLEPESDFLSFLSNPKERREMLAKGYVLNGDEKGDMIIAAKVCINDVRIAESSCISPKSIGYFASKIYNCVLLKEVPSDNGVSVISLSLMTFGYAGTGTDHCEMLYDDYSNFKGDAGYNLFNRNFSQLIEFIASIEEKVNSFPQELGSERDQWEELMPGLVQW